MRKPSGFEALYLDFDSFFASAEQHLRPELRGRPVGVIPIRSPDTSVIAASRQAKAFGVRTGTRLREARELCPDIVVVVARHDEYVRLHHRILETVAMAVPVAAVRSIDEVYCRLLDNEQERALDIAKEIKARLRHDIGPVLTCSIGLAPNELLAKIGAEMNKPDGLVTLHPGDLPGPLLSLALTDLPGIAGGNAERLSRAGIMTVADLWRLGHKQARALWGNVEGERFLASLHGYAVERPATRRAMFGHSRILPRDWRNRERAHGCARLLLVKAARRMRREHYAAGALLLHLRAETGERWSGEERTHRPLRDDRGALSLLEALFARQRLPGRIKSVHVCLHRLISAQDAMPDLFADEASRLRNARWERLSDLGDQINGRYGHAALTLGWQPQPDGGYAGAKIAFGRIPDAGDF
jgi:DNA polymerase-4